jgi:hypothetical protein
MHNERERITAKAKAVKDAADKEKAAEKAAGDKENAEPAANGTTKEGAGK